MSLNEWKFLIPMNILPWIKTWYTEDEEADHNVDGVNHSETEHKLVEVSLHNLGRNSSNSYPSVFHYSLIEPL